MKLDQRTRLNDLFQAIGVKQPAEPDVSRIFLESASESRSLLFKSKTDEAKYRTETIDQFRLHASADYRRLTNSLKNGTLVELLSVSAEGFRKTKQLKSDLILETGTFESRYLTSKPQNHSEESEYLGDINSLIAAWQVAEEQQILGVQRLLEFFENSAKLIDQRIMSLLRR